MAAPPNALAAAPSRLLVEAQAKALAMHRYWLALLHYSGGSSEVRSPAFFLSPAGAHDPAAELAATLSAFFDTPGPAPDTHAQCRFVARYQWLRRQLDWSGLNPPQVTCPRYRAYSANGAVTSVSVIYATGYLSNPASFYGHILVKFNTPAGTVANELLDQSVNFGAAVPPHENPFVYVAKGLFGGYDAAFTSHQFYSINHAYAENELRDLWEYVLRLDAAEVDALVAHSWELLGQTYDYYFLKENCAFRMAGLLELVLDDKLLPDLPWSLPSSVFDRLVLLERDGMPLVTEVRRIPSRQSTFRERYAALGPSQRSLAARLVERQLDFRDAEYESLPAGRKVEVVDTLLDYYEYRIVSDRNDAGLPKLKQKLLIARAGLPRRTGYGESDEARVPRPAPPHEGPLPFLVRTGIVHNNTLGDGVLVQLRPTSYDALSLDAGRIPNSTLAVADVKAILFHDGARIRSIDLFNVENLNAPATPLPLDGGMAWRLRAAVDEQDLACSHCHVAKFEGGLGAASPVGGVLGFVMLDAAIQSDYADSGWLSATPRVGLVGEPLHGWKTYLSVGRRAYLAGDRGPERVLRWEQRFGTQRDWDVRVSYEQHVAHEIQAALSFYW
jgi:hypothetical protein